MSGAGTEGKRQRTDEAATLLENATDVEQLLRERKPKGVAGLTPELHSLPPFLPKARWGELGDFLKAKEAEPRRAADGSQWMTMRLDGNGFSKYTKYLKRKGVIEAGYAPAFGEAMQAACKAVMEKFAGWVAYTQSDEMSVVIPPASVVRGQQMPHPFNGRTQKVGSLAASYCSAVFNHHIMTMWNAKRDDPFPLEACAIFDCRMAAYDTGIEACSLLWWRAYDSGINGVSDACHHQKGKVAGAKEALAKGNDEKLLWLLQNDLLPLSPHQAYGTFFKKARVEHQGTNPLTGEVVTTTRSKTFQSQQCVLTMFSSGEVDYRELPQRNAAETVADASSPKHAADTAEKDA
ncbi:hypothetical protein DIPPA_21337 [Diplonema papillatum]|nr:hypothetical protein DIPPA_21337 [Diplonema papillatum]